MSPALATSPSVPVTTLAQLIEHEAVPLTTLRERYGALLSLVETLLGVVPNCDSYLEIWPTAFRSYNVMVPNLLNLPNALWGFGAPRSTVGLAMYVASRTAGCPYCSAHTCTFALRRGATVDQVAGALDGTSLSDADRAAVRVARALASVPSQITDEDRAELRRHFKPEHEEWIVLSIAMMGWLNRTMDALGIPLEAQTISEVNDVIATSGWAPGKHLVGAQGPPTPAPRPDSLRKCLGVIRHAPSAVSLDKAWTKGVPDRDVGAFLREATGHDFPVLGRLRHRRAVRAIATMIRDNFTNTIVGRAEKLAAGLVFAETVGSASLAAQLRAAGAAPVADSPVQTLARAACSSPLTIDAATMTACQSLSPAAVVEVVTFISLMQLLHWLESYYAA